MMFGTMLRQLRKKAQLFLKDLADAAGLSVVYVSDMERERRSPPSEQIIQTFCKTLEPKLGYYPHELFHAAMIDRGRVEINVQSRSETAQNATFKLARLWDDMTDEQIEEAAKVIAGLRDPTKKGDSE